ncbi:hypothetical protein EDD16DRAFT_861446 [Pisolithus croceorrhizus]|nr:hypothetical protein EDD16DRAFT_861446 [Pisolithus croceorrhizus]
MAPKCVGVLAASWVACAGRPTLFTLIWRRATITPFGGVRRLFFFSSFLLPNVSLAKAGPLGKADLISRLVKVKFAHRGGNFLTSTVPCTPVKSDLGVGTYLLPSSRPAHFRGVPLITRPSRLPVIIVCSVSLSGLVKTSLKICYEDQRPQHSSPKVVSYGTRSPVQYSQPRAQIDERQLLIPDFLGEQSGLHRGRQTRGVMEFVALW